MTATLELTTQGGAGLGRRASHAGSAWERRAGDLADWARRTLVVREDVYEVYARDGKASRKRRRLTRDVLAAHFAGEPDARVGLHMSRPDARKEWVSRWGVVEIYSHGEPDATERNRGAAVEIWRAAERLRFSTVLEESGPGRDFCVWVLFDRLYPATGVRDAVRVLADPWRSLGLRGRPETSPRTGDFGPSPKAVGNVARLPGRHPAQGWHWSRFWDGLRWLEGDEAVAWLLAREGRPLPDAIDPGAARPESL